MTAWVLFATLAALDSLPCESTAETNALLAKVDAVSDDEGQEAQARRQVELLRTMLGEHPRDLDLHERYMDLERFVLAQRDAVVAEYRALAAKQPDDAFALHLYARALADQDPEQAVTLFEKAIAMEPRLSAPQRELARIHLGRKLKDPKRARRELEAFRAACPATPAGFDLVGRLEDPGYAGKSAKALRSILASRTDPEGLSYYTVLWELEFKAVPPARHAPLRAQAAKDLARLRELLKEPSKDGLDLFKQGYELTADEAGRAWVEQERIRRFPGSDEAADAALEAWQKANPSPKPAAAKDELEEWERKRFAETETWVKRWPKKAWVWAQRLSALRRLAELPDAEVETAAARLLELPEDSMALGGAKLLVAETFEKRGLHPDRLEELVNQAAEEDGQRVKALESQLAGMPPKMKDSMLASRGEAWWKGRAVLLRAALRASDVDREHALVAELDSRLAKEAPAAGASEPYLAVHHAREAASWYWRGKVALADGHKADALAWFARAARARSGPRGGDEGEDPRDAAEQLWAELGGAKETYPYLSGSSPSAAVTEETPWEKRDKPLVELGLSDLGGKVWKLSDLKGKTVFINVWATWCHPCQLEMPALKKLQQRFKGNRDVVFLAFDTDENTGLVEPFVAKEGLSMPVLLARAWAERMALDGAIPRNLVVDRNGVLRYERVGYGGDEARWVEEGAKAIAEVRGPARK
jgi:thiol-disulfide isomerase/thioredoxin